MFQAPTNHRNRLRRRSASSSRRTHVGVRSTQINMQLLVANPERMLDQNPLLRGRQKSPCGRPSASHDSRWTSCSLLTRRANVKKEGSKVATANMTIRNIGWNDVIAVVIMSAAYHNL